MTVNGEYRKQNSAPTDNQVRSNRMIYRHPTDHSLGGVCAGLADFAGWDPVLVRALWVVATFVTSGAGLLVYLLLWLLLPVGSQSAGQLRPAALQFGNLGGSRMATVLLVVGGLWLLSNLGILPALAETGGLFLRIFFWPLLLIGVGYMLLRGCNTGLRARFDELRNNMGENVRSVSEQIPSVSTLRGAVDNTQAGMPFRRSRSNRILLGVCGGMSARFGIDANLIRLMWAVLAMGTLGVGVFAYLVLALLVPEEGSHWAPPAGGAQTQDVPITQAAPVAAARSAAAAGSAAAPAAPAPATGAHNDVSLTGGGVVHF